MSLVFSGDIELIEDMLLQLKNLQIIKEYQFVKDDKARVEKKA